MATWFESSPARQSPGLLVAPFMSPGVAGRFVKTVKPLALSILRGFLVRRVPAAGTLLLGLPLLIMPVGALAQAPAPDGTVPAERLLYLVQYIAVDYGRAVRDGAIVNPFEYREMQSFSRLLVDRFDELRAHGASEQTRRGLVELRQKILAARPWEEVRSLANDLAASLVRELDVVALPVTGPSVERGRRLYGRMCASCHGATGQGDGSAGRGLDPPPTSFSDSRMDRVSPHQMYGAIRFGVEGTAMSAYEADLAPERIWDIAFFLLTLRSGFAPHPPDDELPITLSELTRLSNEDLLARLRASGVAAEPAHIDHYRRSPKSARSPEPVARPERSSAAASGRPSPGSSGPGTDLAVALQLQDAFAGVAEGAAKSVVGVTGFVRRADGNSSAPEAEGSWREGPLEERLYPGFRRVRSGSGFFVSTDGHVLTARHLLLDDAGKPVDVVDLELFGGQHYVARIVGTEPTLNLAVLQLEHFSRTRPPRLRPARIGDSDEARVGHWAIALGNPWGPGRTFAVGTLSSRPERECYQEELTATLMQTSLSIPAGGYGGPLMNIEGEVVGMMVPGPGLELPALATLPRALESALPINLAMGIYEALKVKESRRSPWLGFSVLDFAAARRMLAKSGETPQFPRTGVYIDDVFEPSPAAAAGVRVGDSLVSIDGERFATVRGFQRRLYLSGVGRTITLEIYRDGETLKKRVVVEERPAAVVPR